MSDLKGRVVWVTGASMGIGRGVALELAHAGARLGLTARSVDKLKNLKSEIEEMGCEVCVATGDVTDLARMHAAAGEIEAALGPIDVLFSCAGIAYYGKPEDFSAEGCAKIMRVNYEGMLHCIEATLPKMIERGGGYIVGVSSLTAYRGLPTAPAYCASKAATTSFLESLRFDVEPKNVDVTIVSPGFVRTPMTDQNDFEMPFLMEVDDAARIIVKGMQKRKKEIHFPKALSVPLKIMRAVPYPIYEFLIKRKVAKS